MQASDDHDFCPVKLPRVLVVNTWPFNLQTNMGQTLHAVFKGYPKEKLACVDFCPSTVSDFPDSKRNWRMARPVLDSSLLLPRWRRFHQTECAGTLLAKESATNGARASALSARFGPLCNAICFRIPGIFRSGLEDWIEQFRPQLLFSQAAPGHLLPILDRIRKRWRLPVVIHVTDDWVEWYPTERSVARSLLQRSGAKAFSRVIRTSKLNLVISDAMADEYSTRYGGEFEVVMNPYLFGPSMRPAPSRDQFLLAYTGVLEPDRWRVLLDIGRAIDLGETGAKLEVRAPKSDVERVQSKFIGVRSVTFQPFVSADRLETVLTEANALVHVESRLTLRRTRLAMSTKLGSYLSAGRPILAVGPLNCASIRYLSRLDVGPVLELADIDTVNEAIARMRNDRPWTLECAARARTAAELNHNPTRIRRRLWAKFQSIAEDNQSTRNDLNRTQ
jgi:hypothetical protein